VNLKYKKPILAIATLFILFFIGYLFNKNHFDNDLTNTTEQKKNEIQVKVFNEKLIPLYLKKIEILKKYFKTEKDQGEMAHFFYLSKNWSAKTMNDVEIILELAGYLDQKVITAISSLNEKKRPLFIQELEAVERDIRKIDGPYLEKIIQNRKLKN
jgi:hypothetical protein